MEQDKELELEFSEQTQAMIEELSRKTGQPPEVVVETIIHNHLMHQVPFIEKKAVESGKTVQEILNQQFVQLIEFMLKRDSSK
ncbi:hypothetical protein [Desulfallas thermosapovorans]|uniref:Uncharacterized protein n=1 Tax=Desulfallas thermosapovorans DSM 6562 TaxID=1121431 RepID=A0A5S4ZQN2_9FIRM|nr:hypothetical protein [Desulfallas thermosapovorans]TYO94926.1 hypothetical protein LX24_01941 [Desulfallas thermosapovorans DSM 6562]